MSTRRRLRKRFWDEGGQVASEYLMVAGILTAIAVLLAAIIVPGVVVTAKQLFQGIRTPAP